LCGGAGHWLIKRFIKNGKVINSTTETIAPRKTDGVPARVSQIKRTDDDDLVARLNRLQFCGPSEVKRTCNWCIEGKTGHLAEGTVAAGLVRSAG
jgi:next-to-BRCA1 protein 1